MKKKNYFGEGVDFPYEVGTDQKALRGIFDVIKYGQKIEMHKLTKLGWVSAKPEDAISIVADGLVKYSIHLMVGISVSKWSFWDHAVPED